MHRLPGRSDFRGRWHLFDMPSWLFFERRNRTVRRLPGQLHGRLGRRLPGLLAWILRITGRVHLFCVPSWPILGRRWNLCELSGKPNISVRRSLHDMRRWL
jgi:hypothetical protein